MVLVTYRLPVLEGLAVDSWRSWFAYVPRRDAIAVFLPAIEFFLPVVLRFLLTQVVC